MRIITGSQRGRKLVTLEGLHTRPTSEKVKEALFSIIQFEIEGRRVLDLFAGSGQLGLEALSRGARECVFVDNDRNAMRIIRENAEKCGFTDKSRFYQNDYTTVLKRSDEKYDIILIDPPYASSYYDKSLKLISAFDILARNGIIVVESESDQELPEEVGTIRKVRDYRYGRTKLTVYRNNTADS
ncbi:MAG: 16S rRNA (guanine(966)-N(2))-methyltransferase RsmD [Clostridiales bacterium]|nr:16S rRNA (guanine(966)-N(2))-methyltransferase RsmD [Clostridiales bacterium]